MFNQTRYGRYSQTVNNNNSSATLKLLAFVAVVCIFGFSMWALFSAANSWTTAVGRTWNAENNNALVHEIGGAIGDAIILVAGVVSGLGMLAMIPWFIRNMRVALNSPVPGGSQRYNVIDVDRGEQDDQVGGLIEESAPVHGLLIDGSHEEHYIPAARQLPKIQTVRSERMALDDDEE